MRASFWLVERLLRGTWVFCSCASHIVLVVAKELYQTDNASRSDNVESLHERYLHKPRNVTDGSGSKDSQSNPLSSTTMVLLIISLVMLIVASVGVLCSLLSKAARDDHHQHSYHTQLVDLAASRYREDVFCSDEFQQLWSCSACSFENFEFQSSCSLCGTSMDSMFSPIDTTSAEPFALDTTPKSLSSCQASASLDRHATSNSASPSPTTPPPPPTTTTTTTTTTTATVSASTAVAVIKNRSRNCSMASTVTSMVSLSESFLNGMPTAATTPRAAAGGHEMSLDQEESKSEEHFSSSTMANELLHKLELEQQRLVQSQRFEQATRRKRWSRTVEPDGKLVWTTGTGVGESEQAAEITVDSMAPSPPPSIVQPFVSYLERVPCHGGGIGRLVLEPAHGAFASCCCRFSGKEHPSNSSASTSECPHMQSVALHDAALVQMNSWNFPQKQLWFMGECNALMNRRHKNSQHTLLIPRHDILRSSMTQMTRVSQIELHCPLRVQFQGEPGIDAGGLVREWFSLVTQEFLDEANGLFMRVANAGSGSCVYTINPNVRNKYPQDHLRYFCAFGRCIGKALLEGQLISVPFASPLFKHLLGIPIDFSDLEMMDPLLAQSLGTLQNLTAQELQELELDFSICEEAPSAPTQDQAHKPMVRIVDLKANGRHLAVTVENRQEYLDLLFRWTMAERMNQEAAALAQGVYDVVPFGLLSVFDQQELELLLCGKPHVDVEDWERNTIVCGGAKARRMAKWFWRILRRFSNDQRCKLLQFTTGSTRVPVHGFRALATSDGRICPFTFNCVSKKNCGFLRAFTCFNRLDVPVFASERDFEEALRLLVQLEVTGFSMN